MAKNLTLKSNSNANSVNPKDLIGNNKVSISKLPAIAVAQASMAMMDGAAKYGAWNWRDKDVIAGIYVDALLRHVYCWFEGQERASDSKVHHLGHALACCAILLDAQATGHLVDDRPVERREGKEHLDWLNAMTPQETEEWKADGRTSVIDGEWMERELGDLSKVIEKKKGSAPVKQEIPVSQEAVNALRRKPPTDMRLLQMLDSNEEKDMPTSEQVRWMAGEILKAKGVVFVPERKIKAKK